MEFPLHIRDIRQSDPFILADEASHMYYTYAARFNPEQFPGQKKKGAFYALASRDLIHWSEPQLVFEKGDFWADLDYWAPECHIWKGRYYLISTFRAEGTYRGCQCLVADSPLGPFKPVKNHLVTPPGWQCLDGTLYVDKAGKPWLVFCHEWLQVCDGQIAAVPLSEDLGEAVGDPIILFRGSEAPWRKKDTIFVTDGCFPYRCADGTLLMLWSSFSDRGYTTGYARSLSGEIYGPWIQEELPIYSLDGAHSMLFRTFEGQLMMSLHSPNIHQHKRILLFEMEENAGKLQIINEVTGNWNQRIGDTPGQEYKSSCPCIEEPQFTHLASLNFKKGFPIYPHPETVKEETAAEAKKASEPAK